MLPVFNAVWCFQLRALHTEISRNVLMILWTVNGKIPKSFVILWWETSFQNYWSICSYSCSHIGKLHPIHACDDLSPLGCLFHTHHDTITCFQLTCGMFQVSIIFKCWIYYPWAVFNWIYVGKKDSYTFGFIYVLQMPPPFWNGVCTLDHNLK